MLIVTAKVPRRGLRWGGLACALLLCACALLPPAWELLPAVRPASAQSVPSPKGVRSNEDRVSYLEGWGWQVSGEPIATEELLIPDEMDESYQDYLALQREQGFDLTAYAGKRVKRYTYQVLNYPSGEEGVQAEVLICRGTVVGGEVLSPRTDGFIHGLAMPQG